MSTASRQLMKGIAATLVGLCALLSGCTRAHPVMEPIGVLELPHGIQSMAWHPDGKRLAVGYFNVDEVEVWDVWKKEPLFKVPSKRRPINQSGQEVTFSPDGKYMVVQDFKDTRNGNPPFPRSRDDPIEISARADKQRYALARVWDVEHQKEIGPILGPGSAVYGDMHRGMCWLGNQQRSIALNRVSRITIYDSQSLQSISEFDLGNPFHEHPDVRRGYQKMVCHPTRPLVALEGSQFFNEAPKFGFPAWSGATPIVIADVEKNTIVKVLYTPTPLNGVIWTADGSKLVSFGAPPIRVWDATRDFAVVGEIRDPNANTGDFAVVPGYDGILGVARDITIWNAGALKKIGEFPSPRDIFRIAVHEPSGIAAVASRSKAYLYKFNRDALASHERQ